MPLVEDENRYRPGEEKYWLAFSRVAGIGAVRLRRLFDYFGGLEAAWAARAGDLQMAGLETRLTERLLNFRPTFSPDDELARLEKLGIGLVTLESPGYPARLAQIDSPPLVLYLKGQLTEADNLALAVVGTRRASGYGRQATGQLCADLVGQGVTIVSGLAKGIDTVAHQSTLEAGGRTLAVLGCGVDIVYPPENRGLMSRIAEQGAVISEFAPGTPPEANNFPLRNRVVSGLSVGVLIVESGEAGGAIITVKCAHEQGRNVYGLPGSIYSPTSAGVNALLRRGEAQIVTSAADIMEDLRPGGLFDAAEAPALAQISGDNPVEAALLRLLRQTGDDALHIDEVCQTSQLPMAEVSSALVLLELRGLVQNLGGMRYGLTRLAR